MEYVLNCSCGQCMRVEERHIGRTGKCAKCGAPITVTREAVIPVQTDGSQSHSRSDMSAGGGASTEWKIGDVILDQYEVKAELGRGGMGAVYLVHDRSWDVDFAVKVPQAAQFESAGQRENFVRECHTWMDLGLHPHIVTCQYVRVIAGVPNVFAEYVDGGSLQSWIEDGRLYEGDAKQVMERILSIAIQFAWGLHYAHQKGLVHQDVKPANVMMTTEGVVKVTDFGLANARAAMHESTAMPEGGSILASYGGMTPAYCSPEQADNAARHQAGVPPEQLTKLTRRTDVYSWAVSIFEMFTGGVTWQAGNVVGYALDKYLESNTPVDDLPAMPEAVKTVLQKCLNKEPEIRPREMHEVAEMLKGVYREVTGRAFAQNAPDSATELADVLNNKAVSFLELGKPLDAERLWQEALRLDPHHTEATYNYGLHQWEKCAITDRELVRRMEEVRNSQTGDWQDEYLLGLVHIARLEREGALRVLNEAKQASGNAPKLLRALKQAHGLSLGSLRTYEGHKNIVASMCVSMDGHWVLSGSYDHTLRLWEISTGRCIHTFQGHTNWVESVCLSIDARWALSNSADRTARVWEVATGRCVRTFEANTASWRSICSTANGLYTISVGNSNICMWDVSTGRRMLTFRIDQGNVTSVGLSLSADGCWVLSGNADKTLRLWEVATGRCVRTLEGHTGPVRSVFLTDDGRRALSSSSDNTLRVWDISTGQCVRMFQVPPDGMRFVRLTNDGRWVLSGGGEELGSVNHALRLWNVSTGRCIHTFEEHKGNVHSVCLSADGRWILSGNDDGTLRLWDMSLASCKQQMMPPYALSNPVTAKAAGEDDRRFRALLGAAKTALGAGRIQESIAKATEARSVQGRERDSEALDLWNTIRGHTRISGFRGGWHRSSIECEARAVCLTADGRWALSGGKDKSLYLWDVSSGRQIRSFEGHTNGVKCVCVTADGRWALSAGVDRTFRLWDVPTGRCVRSLFEGDRICEDSASITADGRWVLSCGGKTLRLWQISTGECVRTFEGHSDTIYSVCITPDGRWALSGSDDKTLRLWEISTGRCVRKFKGHTNCIRTVCVSADGRWALSGSYDHSLRLWDVSTGRCVHMFKGHTEWVLSVCITADGRWALSGSQDSTLRLWDASTGECVRIFEGHRRGVHSVCLSADGRWALSGSDDKTIRLWELDWELDSELGVYDRDKSERKALAWAFWKR